MTPFRTIIILAIIATLAVPQLANRITGRNVAPGWHFDPDFLPGLASGAHLLNGSNLISEANLHAVTDSILVASSMLPEGLGQDNKRSDLLTEIANTIVNRGIDVLLIRNVDFHAHRTDGIDEALELSSRSGLNFIARAAYYDVIVPPLIASSVGAGRILSGTAILSRYPIVWHQYFVFDRDPVEHTADWFERPGAFQVAGIVVNQRQLGMANVAIVTNSYTKLLEQLNLAIASFQHLAKITRPQNGRHRPANRLWFPEPVLLAGQVVSTGLLDGLSNVRQETVVRMLTGLAQDFSYPASLKNILILLPGSFPSHVIQEPDNRRLQSWSEVRIDLIEDASVNEPCCARQD